MTTTQDQILNIVDFGNSLLRILPSAPPQPEHQEDSGFRFLVECSDQEDPELHLVVDVGVDTPSLHAVQQLVKDSLGQSWECTQIWLPAQDWLSTGALLH